MKKIFIILTTLFATTYSYSQQIFSNNSYIVEEKQLGQEFRENIEFFIENQIEYSKDRERKYGWFDGGMSYFESTIFKTHNCFLSKSIIVKGHVVARYYKDWDIYAYGFIGKRDDDKVTFLRSFKIKHDGEFKVKIKPSEQIYFQDVGFSTLELTVLKKPANSAIKNSEPIR